MQKIIISTSRSIFLRSHGFTLIELLVVISIISLLASIVIGALGQARDRANVTKARTDVREIIQTIIIAQGESGRRLVEFAPNTNWTAGSCTASGNTPLLQGCFNKVNTAMNEIEAATAGIVAAGSLPRRDPWGVPYQFDANWGENISGNYCILDTFYLVQPSGVVRTITNPVLPRIPNEPRNSPQTVACP